MELFLGKSFNFLHSHNLFCSFELLNSETWVEKQNEGTGKLHLFKISPWRRCLQRRKQVGGPTSVFRKLWYLWYRVNFFSPLLFHSPSLIISPNRLYYKSLSLYLNSQINLTFMWLWLVLQASGTSFHTAVLFLSASGITLVPFNKIDKVTTRVWTLRSEFSPQRWWIKGSSSGRVVDLVGAHVASSLVTPYCTFIQIVVFVIFPWIRLICVFKSYRAAEKTSLCVHYNLREKEYPLQVWCVWIKLASAGSSQRTANWASCFYVSLQW